MEAPRLPPAVAGRSALPAFLPVEAWAREKTAAAREAAQAHLRAAEAEAAKIRADGEEALKQAVLDGEREALRDVESRTRDRISGARSQVEAWINRAEEASQSAVAAALDILCGGPAPDASAPTRTATGSDPKGREPTGSDATGSEPTGSEPTGSEPTGSEPTGGRPSDGGA